MEFLSLTLNSFLPPPPPPSPPLLAPEPSFFTGAEKYGSNTSDCVFCGLPKLSEAKLLDMMHEFGEQL